MSMSRPAVLSSALMARKGAAVPTDYTPIRPQDVNTAGRADENAGDPPPIAAVPAVAGGGPISTDSERTRVSVRLDRERHLKLRLTAAHLQNSLQDIITDALDRYLAQIGPEILRRDCVCLGLKNGAAPRAWRSD